MICGYCKKQIARPLELFNGDWACPRCKKVLNIKSISVCVTEENDETAKLAELCYLRALKSSENKPAYDRNLSSAVEYCRTAARMGNPKALIRLGFFYENGYMPVGEKESRALAAEYYKSVFTGSVRVDMNTHDPDYIDGGKKLQNAAARLYLELIKKQADESTYLKEKQKIMLKGLYVPDDSDVSVAADSRVQSLFKVLSSCASEEKSPLFGLLRVEADELGSVLGYIDDNKNKPKIVELAKKIRIVFFNAENGTFQTVKTENNLMGLDRTMPYYLYFFNEIGVHDISRRACVKIAKALKKSNALGEYAGVKRMIGAISKSYNVDYIFTEDDVLMYKSRFESFEHATGDLIDSIAE